MRLLIALTCLVGAEVMLGILVGMSRDANKEEKEEKREAAQVLE